MFDGGCLNLQREQKMDDKEKLEITMNTAHELVGDLLQQIDDKFADNHQQKLQCLGILTESLLHTTLAAFNDHLTPAGYAGAVKAFQDIVRQHKDVPVPPVSGIN